MRDDLLANGYFLGAASGDMVLLQAGVARVNCLDCLDRTNVIEVSMRFHVLYMYSYSMCACVHAMILNKPPLKRDKVGLVVTFS